MGPEDLPRIDEHAVEVAATPEAVWPALIQTITTTLSTARMERIARLLGCDPASASGWSRLAPDCSLPGFRVEAMEPPSLITLTGQHRFSEYALTFRIDGSDGGARCRAESRALFPGLPGRLYRIAVLGSQGHRILVRRLLHNIKGIAEQAP